MARLFGLADAKARFNEAKFKRKEEAKAKAEAEAKAKKVTP